MLALKGENNCKYKHGEEHLELEQTCFSDSLTVTWGWNRSQNHCPTGHTLSCFVWLILSHTHINRHTCTNTTVRRGARQEKRLCLAGQLYGQAEISGCFPSSKLLVSVVTDRQSDSQTLPLADSHAHAQMHSDWHRDGQTRLMDKEAHSVGRGTKKIPQSDKQILPPNTHQWLPMKLGWLSFYFIDTCFACEFDLPALNPIVGPMFKSSSFTFSSDSVILYSNHRGHCCFTYYFKTFWAQENLPSTEDTYLPTRFCCDVGILSHTFLIEMVYSTVLCQCSLLYSIFNISKL